VAQRPVLLLGHPEQPRDGPALGEVAQDEQDGKPGGGRRNVPYLDVEGGEVPGTETGIVADEGEQMGGDGVQRLGPTALPDRRDATPLSADELERGGAEGEQPLPFGQPPFQGGELELGEAEQVALVFGEVTAGADQGVPLDGRPGPTGRRHQVPVQPEGPEVQVVAVGALPLQVAGDIADPPGLGGGGLQHALGQRVVQGMVVDHHRVGMEGVLGQGQGGDPGSVEREPVRLSRVGRDQCHQGGQRPLPQLLYGGGLFEVTREHQHAPRIGTGDLHTHSPGAALALRSPDEKS
jgi:hypothetical protein